MVALCGTTPLFQSTIPNREFSTLPKLLSLLSMGLATSHCGLANMFSVYLMPVTSSCVDSASPLTAAAPHRGHLALQEELLMQVLWESFPAEGEALFISLTITDCFLQDRVVGQTG